MTAQVDDPDQEMHEVEMEFEEDDIDNEIRNGNTIEVEINSEDDLPPSDSDGEDIDEDKEIGVVDEDTIYNDDSTPIPDDAVVSGSHKESVLAVAFSPTDRSCVVTGGQDDSAVVWSLNDQNGQVTCTEKCRLTGHTDSVNQVAFSHDGVFLATGSYDGTIRIWNAADGSLAQSLEGPSKEIEWILWHPKGHAILAGSQDTMAWMWWAPTGKLMQIFAGHAQSVNCGCWGLGGKVICTGSEDRSVIVWNPRAGAPQQTIKQVHETSIITMCSHPEAPLVVTGAEDGTVKVLQIETGKVVTTLTGHSDSIECIAFSNPAPGGLQLLATAGMDGKVIVWDGKTFDIRCTLQDHVGQGGVVRFKWLPAGMYGGWLCTCATDRTLRLFNALTGECVRTLQGHRDTVLDLDLSLADGKNLCVAAGSDDRSFRLFVVAMWTSGDQANAAQAGYPTAAASSGAQAAAQPTLPAGAQVASPTTADPGSPSKLPV